MSKQLLTHSRMESFKRCRRRHYFEYEVGLRKQTDAKALRMGSAGHEGLDVLKHRQAAVFETDDTVNLPGRVPYGRRGTRCRVDQRQPERLLRSQHV